MKIGIVGVSGFGGSELLRLCASHPTFEIAYVGGDSTSGQTLAQRFPGIAGTALGDLKIAPFVPENISGLDLLFASLPTGKSREPLAKVAAGIKVVDVGGDHRYLDGWSYGLTELPGQRERIRNSTRIANPGCYAAPAILALAPLLKEGLVEAEGIVIDGKSGVTGTGRGSASDFGYVETNEDLFAYGLESHPHVPEMEKSLSLMAGTQASIAFTPHIVPMARGIFVTCYARPRGTPQLKQLLEAAQACYGAEPFIKFTPPVRGHGPHTHWATGSNLMFLSYAINPRTGLVLALAAIDNLGKGAAAQALQNANLITGHPESAGLSGLPLWA